MKSFTAFLSPRTALDALVVFAAFLAVEEVAAADPYAKSVVFARILEGNIGNTSTNPANALGAPDGSGVSLGGPGGSLMVDMGADSPVVDGPGPDLEVRELGTAVGGADESYLVLVSNSTDTNTFVLAGQGRALSLIDIHPAGLASARYVWLQDIATESLNSTSPGSDIDSLRVLYASGNTNEVAPPSGLNLRLTGQGVWLSWSASTATNLTGYAIRRSLDGVAFSSTPDVTLSTEEAAWHDLNPPAVSNCFYSVSALTDGVESVPVLGSVIIDELDLLTNQVVHLGDDTVPAWEIPSPQRSVALIFMLPGFAQGPQAELQLDLFDVDNSGNAVLVNGAKVATLPVQSAESWAPRTLRFAAGALQPGANSLVLSARNSSGGTTGSLDDYQVRNMRLRIYGTRSDVNLIAGARYIHILPGQTNVVLRWVVEQTPTLSPASWETVSSPIEWTGAITNTNGFYRLHEVP